MFMLLKSFFMFLVIVLLLIDNTTPVAGSNGTCGRGEPDVNAGLQVCWLQCSFEMANREFPMMHAGPDGLVHDEVQASVGK